MEPFDLGAILAIGGGGLAAGWLVATVTQLIKNVLPETWQNGRGIILVIYVISGALTLVTLNATPADVKPADMGSLVVLGLLVWQGIVQSAIGANQLTRKGIAIASGTTNTSGQDPGS